MNKLFVAQAKAKDWKEALKISSDILLENNCVKEDFFESCTEREKMFPTGLTCECPVAIPHTDKDHVLQNSICALRLEESVEFGRIDDPSKTVDVDLVINMALMDDDEHLVMIKKVITMIQNAEYIKKLKKISLEELRENLSRELL